MGAKYILAGDIGGTKTILGIFSQEGGGYNPLFEKKIKSSNISSFARVVNDFLAEHNIKPFACCFGVAGPVLQGEVQITKLKWQLSEKTLQKDLNCAPVFLINDLAAMGSYIPVIKNSELLVLNNGESQADNLGFGNKTIIAPGTGLGEAFISYSEQDQYTVHSSEGGHALFAPASKLQRELLEFVSDEYEQVTYDLLCSGRGIAIIYSFFKIIKGEAEPKWLAEDLLDCDDKTPIIIASVHRGGGDDRIPLISSRTIELFCEILAAEACNCALRTLASGGVFLAGGIPPRITSFLQSKNFLDQFTNRKPFQAFLSRTPLAVVLTHKAALLGAAHYGMKKMGWV